MSLRVALVTNSFEDYVGELARRLAQTNDVLLVAPDSLEDAFRRRIGTRVELATYPQHRLRDLVAGARAAKAIKRTTSAWAPDIIHHQLGGDPWMTAAVQLLSRRFAVVTTIHEARARLRDEDIWWAAVVRKAAIRHSKQIIVLTDAVGRNIRGARALRLPVTIIELGRAAEGFVRNGDAPRSAARPQLLFFGRIRPYKGLDVLIQAAERVAPKVEAFHLVIAGSGATADELFPGGIPSWAELQLGFIDDSAVAPLFDSSRAVILPYLEASQSGVGATALALGCPVVTTDAGGLADGVIDGVNGLVVPASDVSSLADAMTSILTDRKLADSLRAGALHTAEGTDDQWLAIIDRTVEVYRRTAHA